MKLTNPTNAQLNEAFAEKVCGWYVHANKCCYSEKPKDLLQGSWPLPYFVNSADAVLPWLEKSKFGWCCERFQHGNAGYWVATIVEVETNEHSGLMRKVPFGGFDGRDASFPRAAVLALLRGHGVEVVL